MQPAYSQTLDDAPISERCDSSRRHESLTAIETLPNYLRRRAKEIDAHMDGLIPPAHVRPTTIHQAIRHSLFGGGKRLRSILTLAVGEALGAKTHALLPVACTMEMIHASSLIHDDLPSMDDADVRRGRPTCHIAFGEAMAILAGDALIVRAFHVLATECHTLSDAQRGQLIAELGEATGTLNGLIGGQVVDMESEGVAPHPDCLSYIHNAKTTALIVAAVVAGGIVAGASKAQIELLRGYARCIGLAFQIIDDILDIAATSDQLGKAAGKDKAACKLTYPALYGMDESRVKAEALVEEAIDCAWNLGVDSRRLEQIARFITERLS